jgi:C1A family cysteine protease/predicted secreted protein
MGKSTEKTGLQFKNLGGSWLACATLLSLLLLLAYPVSGSQNSTPGASERILDEGDNGQQVNLREGQILLLRLQANPSTGYLWRVQALDDSILRQADTYQFEPESDLSGAPGTVTLRFEPVAAGRTDLRLAYRRPWEDRAPLRTFSVAIQTQGSASRSEEDRTVPPEAPGKAGPGRLPGVIEEPASQDALPTAFNWCDQEICPPVRDQGACGSCWAFATVAPFESLIKLNDGVTLDLSEQYLVSCNIDGWSCGGGAWAHDYHEWKIPPGELAAGVVSEADFPYVAHDIACTPPHEHPAKLDDWAFVNPDVHEPSPAEIKEAIYEHGPLAIGVCVGEAFVEYSEGVFAQDVDCGGTSVNHNVVLVGWDDAQGSHGAWYLRNSWGPEWGESGYMRIAYGVSDVGWDATYVKYKAVPHVPLAPTSLQAVAVSETGVDLAWVDNSVDEDGFEIERSSSVPTNWQQIASPGANVTSYADTGLTSCTHYYYRVRAYNSYGPSAYSDVASAVPCDYDQQVFLPLVVGPDLASNLPIDEGFESGLVPPTGWTRIQTNPRRTWELLAEDAYEGTFAAQCHYDPELGQQNEILLSPGFQASSAQLDFYSFGNIFWCRDGFDNCDLNIWLVIGEWGGGDDIFVRTADEDWLDRSTWSHTSIDLTPHLPAGTEVRLGFQYEGSDGARIGLDAIHVEE